MLFDRILCATDLSSRSCDVVSVARDLRAAWGDELELVHVHEHAPDTLDQRALFAPTRADDRRQAARFALRSSVAPLGASAFTTFLEGTPHQGILERAQHADLLVVGATRGSCITRLLGWGVAERIIRSSPIPVLVVPIRG
jgi:nucleotide-binding universal stress UspA family protein